MEKAERLNRIKLFRKIINANLSEIADFRNTDFSEPFNLREILLSTSGKYRSIRKHLDWLAIDHEKDIYPEAQENTFDFQCVIFKKEVNLCDSTFNNRVDFSYSSFLKSISFNSVKFEDDANFLYCEFTDELNFGRTTVLKNASFFSSQMHGKTSFTNTKFHGTANLFLVQFFKGINARHIVFNDTVNFHRSGYFQLADFRQCLFNKASNYAYSIFHAGADFKQCQFIESANFTGVTFKEEAEFSNSIFQDRLFLHEMKYTNNTNLNFEQCSIKDGHLVFASIIPSGCFKSRSTAHLFKYATFYKKDSITEMEYRVREMELYNKELKWTNRKDIENKVVLFFNNISNKYGTKWLRGVLFTALSAFFFLILILFFGSNSDIGSLDVWIKGYIGTLNIFNFSDDVAGQEGVKLTALGTIIWFFSKIFVSYGIYQTVAAFRKHGK